MEKMSFKGIKDVLSREEMKSIMAGSSNGGGGGGSYAWTTGTYVVPFAPAGSNSVYAGNGTVISFGNSAEGSTQFGGGSWTPVGGSSGSPDNPPSQPSNSPHTLICTSGNYPVSTCANPYCPTGSFVYCG